jgi:DNA polymerase III subunit alpha
LEYCSLHNHSDYSNIRGLDSTNSLDKLLYTSIEKGIKGVALTDHETLSGHIKWIELVSKLKKENKIPQDFKAILGNEIYLCRDNLNLTNYQKGKDGFWHFILLALDTEGHKQLRELSSRAWEHSFKQFIERVPTYYSDIEEIIGNNKGHIIATTACLGSYFDKLILRKDYEQAKKFIDWAKLTFGSENFFVEFQPGNSLEQKTFNISALSFCKENDINFIITTDAHYPLKEDREIHKAFLTSNQVEREVDAFYESTYVMSSEEIISNIDYFTS